MTCNSGKVEVDMSAEEKTRRWSFVFSNGCALDRWSPDVIEEFFAPSYRRYLNPASPPLTREGQRDRANRLRAGFPDATATLEDILAEGDRVAYRLTIRGTHRNTFQGVPPTGRNVAVSFTAIVRIEQGTLIEEWGGLDLFDLRQQLQSGEATSGAPG